MTMSDMTMSDFDLVLEDVRRGHPVIIVDDKDRENEGDLMIAAEKVTSETVSFMLQEGKGLVCLSLTEARARELRIPHQVTQSKATFGTNFGISFDHRSVLGRGVTAEGRSKTILAAVDPHSVPDDFVKPGYVFPVYAVPGGVLKRRGQTEGSVDLARIAGFRPAGVICEVMAADGEMLRGKELVAYAKKNHFRITSVEEILQYRLQHEVSLRRVADNEMEIPFLTRGESGHALEERVQVIVYVDDVDDKEHLAFVKGKPREGCLARIHSECLTGDVFESRRCDCGNQLHQALAQIFAEGEGVVVYLHQEGRGIGLANKLRAYALQDRGLDTVEANLELGFEADSRDYRAGAQILQDLGVNKVRLLTNNPEKVNSLQQFEIEVLERVPLLVKVDEYNAEYLATKRERLGHLIPPSFEDAPAVPTDTPKDR